MIGLLLLLGIAKKNSIILVDYAVQKQNEGMSAHDAMMKAGPVRLRPIMMTSIATLMAAIPPALALGPGAETRGPMAVAIIGGLVISTALSLLVVPAFFVVADRAQTKVGMVHGSPQRNGAPRKQPRTDLPPGRVLRFTLTEREYSMRKLALIVVCLCLLARFLSAKSAFSGVYSIKERAPVWWVQDLTISPRGDITTCSGPSAP
jgi:hypothetical protein